MSHLKIAAVAAFAALSMLAAGCTAECVDQYDCRPCEKNDAGQFVATALCSQTAKAGEQWTCVSGACKLGNPDPGGVDAGP